MNAAKLMTDILQNCSLGPSLLAVGILINVFGCTLKRKEINNFMSVQREDLVPKLFLEGELFDGTFTYQCACFYWAAIIKNFYSIHYKFNVSDFDILLCCLLLYVASPCMVCYSYSLFCRCVCVCACVCMCCVGCVVN